jgi:transposase
MDVYLKNPILHGICPSCGHASERMHSHYWRTLTDTPMAERAVTLHLRCRKFFCDQQACSQRIFTERHPSWCRPYARKTERLRSFLTKLAFSLAAEAASRLVPFYGVRVSADTFLALVRSEPLRAFQDPAVIGLDDWAMKKGHQYGTLVCDLETKRPIGLFPGRTTEAVKAWLAPYPSIRMVTRDGSREYAKAIAEARPEALQITDRWHLFHHVSRSVDHWLKRVFPGKGKMSVSFASSTPAARGSTSRPLTEKEEQKWQVIQQVQAQHRQGVSISRISRNVSLDRKTVRKYCSLRTPMSHERHRPHSVEPYRSVVLPLVQKGVSSAHIFTVLQAKGYRKSFSTLKDFLARVRANPTEHTSSQVFRLSRSRLHTYLWSPATLSSQEAAAIKVLEDQYPSLREVKDLVETFQQRMQHRNDWPSFEAWVQQAAQSHIPEIQNVSTYLYSDWHAVANAYRFPWSNGLVEGHVNRIKVMKRQMYGRANIDLLRQKVLYTWPKV